LQISDHCITLFSQVDYEIFRTIEAKADLDVIIYNDGKAHMIAGTAIPNEVPYQKNRREMSFPFKSVWSSFANIALVSTIENLLKQFFYLLTKTLLI
jgi:hypothetical protein